MSHIQTLAKSLGLTLLLSSAAHSAVITINQINNTFAPDSVNAQVGDSIVWVWHGGFHTVTSGFKCTPNGLFDGDLSLSIQTFTWVVPPSSAGTTIPYFCSPHCFGGQEGSIIVAPAAVPGDLDCDGLVTGSDLAQFLSAWGTASQPADINVDGIVDGLDLSVLLANWSV